jgi:hypothetical protein
MKPYQPLTKGARIAQLEAVIAKSTLAPAMQRAATLRLSRLKAATKEGDLDNILAGKRQALEAFRALALQRSSLLRRWPSLNAAERTAAEALLLHLPNDTPRKGASLLEDNAAWCNFISGITRCLSACKGLPTKNLKPKN